MPDPVIVAQRRALAVEQALEDTYENAVALGLPTSRIEDIKEEPLLTPEEARSPSWLRSCPAPLSPNVGTARSLATPSANSSSA